MAESGFPNGNPRILTTMPAFAVAQQATPLTPRSDSGCSFRIAAAIPYHPTVGNVPTPQFPEKQSRYSLHPPWKQSGSGGCDQSPPKTPPCQQGSNQAESRNSNSPDAKLRSTKHSPLCPKKTSRNELTDQSSGNLSHWQKTDCKLTRSHSSVGVQRTVRFSRFDSRRKVFSKHEKRNANQCSPTRGKSDCHR